MDKFSTEECQIMWFKNAKLTPKQKQAMKTELKTMSGIIADAMEFIEKQRLADREVYVRIAFNAREIEDTFVYLEVRGESSRWEIDIEDLDNQLFGMIVSEKWLIDTSWAETSFELPETIK